MGNTRFNKTLAFNFCCFTCEQLCIILAPRTAGQVSNEKELGLSSTQSTDFFLRCQKLTTSAHVRGQSNKKLQVHFTLCFGKFTKKIEFNKSLYKFPLQASKLFLQWYFIEFLQVETLHVHTFQQKLLVFVLTQATQAVGVWRRVLRSYKSLSGNVNNIKYIKY